MPPKRVFLVLTIYLGIMFSFAIPRFALGSDESFPDQGTGKYDNLLALDKSSLNELMRLEGKLNSQKRKLKSFQDKIARQRKSKKSPAKDRLKKQREKLSEMRKEIQKTESEIAKRGGLQQLLKSNEYRLRKLKLELRAEKWAVKGLEKIIEKQKRSN
jgi:hypothetical protein